jgi:hypothetical protein
MLRRAILRPVPQHLEANLRGQAILRPLPQNLEANLLGRVLLEAILRSMYMYALNSNLLHALVKTCCAPWLHDLVRILRGMEAKLFDSLVFASPRADPSCRSKPCHPRLQHQQSRSKPCHTHLQRIRSPPPWDDIEK